jgi:hypothetical protein
VKYCLEGREKRMGWNDEEIDQGGRMLAGWDNMENLRQG